MNKHNMFDEERSQQLIVVLSSPIFLSGTMQSLCCCKNCKNLGA